MPRPRRPASSCQDCLSFGDHFYTDLCPNCLQFRRKYGPEPTSCRCCERVLICRDGYCRLCRVQASINAGPDSHHALDLDSPRRTGHQLYLANLGDVRSGGARYRDKQSEGETLADAVALLSVGQRVEQPALFDPPRDVRKVLLRDVESRDARFTEFVLARAEAFGRSRGWSQLTANKVRKGLLILTGLFEPFTPIPASVVQQLTARQMPAVRVLEVLEDLGLLDDDRPDYLSDWIDRRLDGLPASIRTEAMVWITDMREGSERSLPRADQTVINKVRLAAEFLHALDSSYWTLRQVTRDDCKGWIASRGEDRRYAYQALRTMFRVLKARRQIFANPMRNYSLGSAYRPLLEPVAPHRLATAARAADGDPALRLILALTAIHAMRALHIMSILTDDIDLASGRITVGGQQRPLDAYTRGAVAAWLDYRRERWPRSVNPHLVINQRTCHELGPVSHAWAGKRLLALGLTTTALRTDRILDEAAASGGDPVRVASVFGLSHATAVRYAASANELITPGGARATPTVASVAAGSAAPTAPRITKEN